MTALVHASILGRHKNFNVFMQHGVLAAARSNEDLTALNLALASNCTEVIKVLDEFDEPQWIAMSY